MGLWEKFDNVQVKGDLEVKGKAIFKGPVEGIPTGGKTQQYASFRELEDVLPGGGISIAAIDGAWTPGGFAPVIAEAVRQARVSHPMTIRKLSGVIDPNLSPDPGASVVMNLRVNGVPSALSIAFVNGSSRVSDLINSVQVVEGDLIDWGFQLVGASVTIPSEVTAGWEEEG